RRQGPGDPGGEVSRRLRRRESARRPGPAPSPRPELPRPRRRRGRRRRHSPVAGGGQAGGLMPFDARELVYPAFFSRLESIELRARSIVEGSMHGMHRSPYLGMSVEFVSHREYTTGDDLRHLNWKLYARHDRLYIKEYDADTNLNLYLMVDASASMACANNGRSKLRDGSALAAALAHLALAQHDAVGLVLFAGEVFDHLPPRSRPGQFDDLLAALSRVEVRPATDNARALHQAAGLLNRRGIV